PFFTPPDASAPAPRRPSRLTPGSVNCVKRLGSMLGGPVKMLTKLLPNSPEELKARRKVNCRTFLGLSQTRRRSSLAVTPVCDATDFEILFKRLPPCPPPICDIRIPRPAPEPPAAGRGRMSAR